MRFLSDENIAHSVVRDLREAGFDVRDVKEEKQKKRSKRREAKEEKQKKRSKRREAKEEKQKKRSKRREAIYGLSDRKIIDLAVKEERIISTHGKYISAVVL